MVAVLKDFLHAGAMQGFQDVAKVKRQLPLYTIYPGGC